jgi:hypothetical protein
MYGHGIYCYKIDGEVLNTQKKEESQWLLVFKKQVEQYTVRLIYPQQNKTDGHYLMMK